MAQDRQTKAERREMARERARQLRLEQEKRARRNRVLAIIAVVVGALIVVGVIGYIVYQGTQEPMENFDDAVPANTQPDGSITVGSELAAGTVNDGAPVVDVYADYTCSYCGQFEAINGPDLETMAGDGDATYTLRPVAFLEAPGPPAGYSTRGAEALAVVADGAPELVLEANRVLFDLWNSALPTMQATGQEPSDQEIIAALGSVGVPQEVASRITEDTFVPWVEAVTEQAAADGVTGTPTILVDGEEFTGWSQPGALYEAVTGEAPPAQESPSESASIAP